MKEWTRFFNTTYCPILYYKDIYILFYLKYIKILDFIGHFFTKVYTEISRSNVLPITELLKKANSLFLLNIVLKDYKIGKTC